jgi:hypothetical protein
VGARSQAAPGAATQQAPPSRAADTRMWGAPCGFAHEEHSQSASCADRPRGGQVGARKSLARGFEELCVRLEAVEARLLSAQVRRPPPSHAVQRRAKRQIQRVQCTLWSPVRDAACPPSTRGGTRLVRLVRGRGGGNALCGERVSPLATGPKPAPPPPKPGAARGCAHRVRCEIFRGAARVTGAGALGSPAPLPY